MVIPIDIVEKMEKVNELMTEIDELAKHKVKPISFDQETVIEDCIKILKRNIESCESR